MDWHKEPWEPVVAALPGLPRPVPFLPQPQVQPPSPLRQGRSSQTRCAVGRCHPSHHAHLYVPPHATPPFEQAQRSGAGVTAARKRTVLGCGHAWHAGVVEHATRQPRRLAFRLCDGNRPTTGEHGDGAGLRIVDGDGGGGDGVMTRASWIWAPPHALACRPGEGALQTTRQTRRMMHHLVPRLCRPVRGKVVCPTEGGSEMKPNSAVVRVFVCVATTMCKPRTETGSLLASDTYTG